MKKILVISKYYFPHIGGVEKHVYEIGRRLTKKGYKVTVLTERYDSTLKNEENYDGVKIKRISYPHIKYLGLIYIWVKLLRNISLINKSDIVHCHDVFIWYLPFRFIFPRKPVFTTFHGWEGTFPIPIKYLLMKKISHCLSLGTIGVGRFISRYYDMKLDKITYGGVNYSRDNSSKKRKKLILFLGRLEKDTGLETIVQFLTGTKFNVIFCGDGPLRNKCLKVGKVLGFVDPDPYLKSAELCFVSGYLSILEAFKRNCLVIAVYENKLRKDYLFDTPFKKWMVCVNSPMAIKSAVTRYFKSPEKYEGVIRNAYNWANKQTWDNLTYTYIDLWQKH